MKRKLIKALLKKEIAIMQKKYEYKVKDIERNALLEIEEAKEKYLITERVFSLFPDSSIIGIGKNKWNDDLLVVKNGNNDFIYIYLIGKRYQAINNLPRIMATIKTEHPSRKLYIKIEDIQMVDNDIGNGSLAMKYFLKIANELKADYIIGDLSPEDQDHFDRSEKYYENAGFTVTFNDNRTNGSIRMNL